MPEPDQDHQCRVRGHIADNLEFHLTSRNSLSQVDGVVNLLNRIWHNSFIKSRLVSRILPRFPFVLFDFSGQVLIIERPAFMLYISTGQTGQSFNPFRFRALQTQSNQFSQNKRGTQSGHKLLRPCAPIAPQFHTTDKPESFSLLT